MTTLEHQSPTVEYSPLVGLVTIDEVSQALRVVRSTVRRWYESGYFPKPKRYGRRSIRWSADEVNDWIISQNQTR